MTAAKSELYRDLAAQLAALLEGESDRIANAANMAALIYHGLPDLNWAGFYFRNGDELVLGPFQGRPACLRIKIGEGVCGAAAARGEAVLVPDVHDFPGHIACDAASRSELVVPLVEAGEVLGVLDLDSPVLARFDEADREGCEDAGRAVCRPPPPKPGGQSGIRRMSIPNPGAGCHCRGARISTRTGNGPTTGSPTPPAGPCAGSEAPGGIQLHSPELSRRSRPVNHYLRYEAGLGGRVRELAILTTARELGSQFEWAAHEPAALAEGISREIVDTIRYRRDARQLAEADAVVIDLGREIFAARKVSPATYAHALRLFGRRKLIDLVALMGNYAATAALLTAFDMQLDPDQPPPAAS